MIERTKAVKLFHRVIGKAEPLLTSLNIGTAIVLVVFNTFTALVYWMSVLSGGEVQNVSEFADAFRPVLEGVAAIFMVWPLLLFSLVAVISYRRYSEVDIDG